MQKNQNIKKITFKVVQMKSLYIYIYTVYIYIYIYILWPNLGFNLFIIIVFFQFLYFFLELIGHMPHLSELINLNFLGKHWQNYSQICFLFCFVLLFHSKTEVHELGSMRPTINQFQKQTQNSVLIKRRQVEKKKLNAIFGNNSTMTDLQAIFCRLVM